MKKEGRQHGMVRPSHKPANVVHRSIDASANLRAKILSKPSNHSKYTGTCRKVRCTECHSHPVTKSSDKAKGGYKNKSYAVTRNHRLGPEDTNRWNDFKGISATAVLGRLSDDYWNEGDDEEDGGTLVDEIAEELGLSATAVSGFLSNEYVNEVGDGDGEETGCYDDGGKFVDDLVTGGSSGIVEEEEEEEEGGGIGGESCILDGEMDFYQVGFLVEDLDGEDWCVVSEM